jgi:hypothetical protein
VAARPKRTIDSIVEEALAERTGGVIWDLITTHARDMVQVALSIQAGLVTPSMLLRKLGTYSRRNLLYRAFGEIAGTAANIAKALQPSDWKRLSIGGGTKGPRLYDWCYLELADLQAGEHNEAIHGVWTRGLLIRRNIADGNLAYFTAWCPAGTMVETLVHVEGHRWCIEDSFETAKNEFGLDHNETRS